MHKRMHSSRMRTVRWGGGGVCQRGGVCPGVSVWGCVPRGCVPGGLPWGVSAQGGVYLRGVCQGIIMVRSHCPTLRQTQRHR